MTSTETPPPRSAPWKELGSAGSFVDAQVRGLQEGMLRRESSSVAMLAHLRHAAGKPAGSVADIWPVTVADSLAGPHAGDDPTPAEVAVHVAMTLYAVHQQSVPTRMHQRGQGFGRALRALRPVDAETDPVRRRFQAVGTADSLDELVYHARGLVQLLRAERQSQDYALLADQLVSWQRGDEVRVRLQWARDFYRTETGPAGTAPTEQTTTAP
jgi:CRISPR system Cascade subunit CasB